MTTTIDGRQTESGTVILMLGEEAVIATPVGVPIKIRCEYDGGETKPAFDQGTLILLNCNDPLGTLINLNTGIEGKPMSVRVMVVNAEPEKGHIIHYTFAAK